MAIETLDDIVEELANGLGVYGSPRRCEWVTGLKARIRDAVEIERDLAAVRVARATVQQPTAQPTVTEKKCNCDDHDARYCVNRISRTVRCGCECHR